MFICLLSGCASNTATEKVIPIDYSTAEKCTLLSTDKIAKTAISVNQENNIKELAYAKGGNSFTTEVNHNGDTYVKIYLCQIPCNS